MSSNNLAVIDIIVTAENEITTEYQSITAWVSSLGQSKVTKGQKQRIQNGN